MKWHVLKSILVALVMWAIFLIPDSPSSAYPPPQPAIDGPIWYGIHCDYPGTIPPKTGFMEATWIDGFPVGYRISPDNPGIVTVFYAPFTYQYYEWLIVDNYVSHTVGTLWTPQIGASADISGYMRLCKYDGTGCGNFQISPTHMHMYCPQPFIYIPQVFGG